MVFSQSSFVFIFFNFFFPGISGILMPVLGAGGGEKKNT